MPDFLSNITIKLLHKSIFFFILTPLFKKKNPLFRIGFGGICEGGIFWYFCSSVTQKQLIHCISDTPSYLSQRSHSWKWSDIHHLMTDHLQKQDPSYKEICQEKSHLAQLHFILRDQNPHTVFEETFPRNSELNITRKKRKGSAKSLTSFHYYLSWPFLTSSFVRRFKHFSEKFFWNIMDWIRFIMHDEKWKVDTWREENAIRHRCPAAVWGMRGYIIGAVDSKATSKPLHQDELWMASCTKQTLFLPSHALTLLRFQGQEIKEFQLGMSSSIPWPDWQHT